MFVIIEGAYWMPMPDVNALKVLIALVCLVSW